MTIKILMLSASPEQLATVGAEQEYRAIDARLCATQRRAAFELEYVPRVAEAELETVLRRYAPQVLHFSGHGSSAGQLHFVGEGGYAQAGDMYAIAAVFAAHARVIRCVVLNACYSAAQAELIAEHVDVVVGMSSAVEAEAARAFSTGFYEALGHGDCMTGAFESGVRRMALEGFGTDIPRLHIRDGFDATTLYLGAPADPLTRDALIDFSGERQRHQHFFGRQELLHEIDAHLARWTSGWILVTGGPGLGKSALLHHWLSQRERAGQLTAFHFIRRGHHNWADAEVVRASLTAQIERMFPALTQAGAQPDNYLDELLRRVSPLLIQTGQQLVLLVDGLDEAMELGGQRNLVPRIFPLELPAGVVVVAASRPVVAELNWLFRRGGPAHHINLDERGDANEGAVREYWTALGPSMDPPLSPALEGVAVANARGNLLHAVKLHELWTKPGALRSGADVPMGFEGMLEELWERVGALPRDDKQRVRDGLTLLCTARESLPLHVIEDLLGWPEGDGEDEFLPAAREMLRKELWQGQSVYRPFHDNLRDHVNNKLRKTALQKHLDLASFGAWADDRDEFRRGYALRHRVTHLVEAGCLDEATTTCKDVRYLTAKAGEIGVPEVERELRHVASAQQDQHTQLELMRLARVVGASSRWATRVPAALPTLMHDRMLTNASSLREQLAWPPSFSRAFPRLRHPLQTRGLPRVLDGHRDHVSALALLGDGRLVSASRDGSLRVWDVESSQAVVTLIGHRSAVRVVAALPDGRIVSGSHDNTLRVWDVESGESVGLLQGHANKISDIAVLPGGRLVSASGDSTAIVWDVNAGRALKQFEGHAGAITALAVLPEGRLVSASVDKTLRVWDIESGETLLVLAGHANTVNAVAVLADGRVVSGSSDQSLWVWDAQSGEVLAILAGHRGYVRAVAVLANGHVVSGSSDNTLRIWDAASGEQLACARGHQAEVLTLAVLADGRIVSGSADKTVRVWDPTSGDLLANLEGHQDDIRAIMPLADGRIVSGSSDHTLRVWDIELDNALNSHAGHEHAVNSLAVLCDGRLVSASADHSLRVWDVEAGEAVATLVGHTQPVIAVAVLPGGQLVSGSSDNTLRIWDVESGQTLASLEVSEGKLEAVAVLADGRVGFASSDRDNSVQVWDLTSGEVLSRLAGHQYWVTALAVLADHRLVSGSYDKTVRVWKVESGEAPAPPFACESPVNCLAVLPDNRVVVGSQDPSLTIWEPESNQRPLTLTGSQPSICAVTVLRNGLVVSASDDHTLCVWDIEQKEVVATVYGDAAFTSVLGVGDTLVAAGDRAGNVWFIDLLGFEWATVESSPEPESQASAATTSPRLRGHHVRSWYAWLFGGLRASLPTAMIKQRREPEPPTSPAERRGKS